MGSKRYVLLTKYCSGDQIENEMGGACSAYGGEVYTGFWWGNLRVKDHMEDPAVDRRIILRRKFMK